ncbi:MAG: right-handed parallel beta-helix repeat-containing protein [Anaerolineales bacterium]|nr:right-handed parallel beta-helix repeat-containing protein [Anaerolineales bacterium]MDW8160507.1 right-handed parallel beta-helix repeat-containing protein [Anaerolineales bacterium]
MKGTLLHTLNILVSLLVVFSLVTPTSAASPIYVRIDGHDTECNGTANVAYSGSAKPNCAVRTVQKGIDLVDIGGTVYVNDGVYNENITILNKNVKLLSINGRSSTTIQGVSGVGSLATLLVDGATTGVQIGDVGHGFTIVGIDNGNPAVENAALYFRGTHSNAIIKGNEIRANGDHGLLSEYGATITNFVIDSNIFSGKTFVGETPGGEGLGGQFTIPNVPRQLVVMGGGPSGTLTTAVQFTNNQVTGIAGGVNSDGKEQGNTLVTIDADNSLIEGNTFAGVTTRDAASLRARRPGTIIRNNNFSSAGLTPTTRHLFIQSNPLTDELVAANTFDKGVYISDPSGGVVGISLKPFGASAPNGSVVKVLPGTYNEPTGVAINRRITFLGSGSTRSIIKGSFEVYTNTVTIQGFKIENGTTSGGELHGIYIAAGLLGVQIRDNWLVGTWTGGENNFVGGRGVLTGYNVSNLTVENNVIEKWVSGIYLNPTDGAVTVRNNEIKNNWAGAGTDGQANVLFKNNYFIGNIEGIGASAVGASFKVEENAFIGNTDAVKWYNGMPISAKFNWWNGNKGPVVSSNPKGNGQRISSNVEYRPWLCDGTDAQPGVPRLPTRCQRGHMHQSRHQAGLRPISQHCLRKHPL